MNTSAKTAPVPAVDLSAQVGSAPAPRHRHHATATHKSTPAKATSNAGAATLLPKGAACRRSAECASGLCAAESCL